MAKRLKYTRAQRRAALNRILQAVLAEPAIGLSEASQWLDYAVWRDEARIMAGDDSDCKDMSPRENLELQHEASHDDCAEFVDDYWRNLYDIGRELDPGFRKPILGQWDWLTRVGRGPTPGEIQEAAAHKTGLFDRPVKRIQGD